MTANDRARAAVAASGNVSPAVQDRSLVGILSSEAMVKQFSMALPEHLKNNAERYIRTYLTQIRNNPKLLDCDKNSVLGAMMTGAALGLDPSPSLGEFSLVPFGSECTFVLGYKGMLDLAYRGDVQKIWAHEVCEHDDFSMKWGLDEFLNHTPKLDGDRGKVIGYYCAAILPNGSRTFYYMTKDDVEKHAKKYSRSFNSGPWKTEFDSMALKTCARRLFTWLPKSTEMAAAITHDEAVIKADMGTTIKAPEDVFDMPVENIEEVQPEPAVTEEPAEQAA